MVASVMTNYDITKLKRKETLMHTLEMALLSSHVLCHEFQKKASKTTFNSFSIA
jgi:hypothetical protein